MKANIFEIKCRISDPKQKHALLMEQGADYRGKDHQIDTYFKVDIGRLKLREGEIENTLIRYHREEVKAIKQSKVIFQPLAQESVHGLKDILSDAYGQWKIVNKQRQIYFIDNVKFHIDEVEGLGAFMEIEAIDEDGNRSSAVLESQCTQFVTLLGLDTTQLIDKSYSDMVPENS